MTNLSERMERERESSLQSIRIALLKVKAEYDDALLDNNWIAMSEATLKLYEAIQFYCVLDGTIGMLEQESE